MSSEFINSVHEKIPNTANGEFVCNIGDLTLSNLYVIYPIDVSSEQTISKPLHKHLYYEFIYFFDGEALFESKTDTLSLASGDCIIISPTCDHRILNIEKSSALKIGVRCSEKKVRNHKNFSIIDKRLTANGYLLVNDPEHENDLRRVFLDFLSARHSAHRISSSFVNLFYFLCECISEQWCNDQLGLNYNHSTEDMIGNILFYKYMFDISAKQAAEAVFLSERQVNRICHKLFGRSFLQQKNYYRIENAKKQLRQSNKSISQICMDCGFSSLGNFYAMFSKLEGKTPRQYREEELCK